MRTGLIHVDGLRYDFNIFPFFCFRIFILTFPVTSASSGSLTAWLDIYSSQTLIRPTWPPLVPHHYFPSLSAIFSTPALIRFFPHLLIFSAPLSLFLCLISWYFESAVCILKKSLCSHCFTVPRAKQVSCSSRPVSLETMFENRDASFKHVSVLTSFFFFFYPPSHTTLRSWLTPPSFLVLSNLERYLEPYLM